MIPGCTPPHQHKILGAKKMQPLVNFTKIDDPKTIARLEKLNERLQKNGTDAGYYLLQWVFNCAELDTRDLNQMMDYIESHYETETLCL